MISNMEVSSFCTASVNPLHSRTSFYYTGTVSHLRDFSSFPCLCMNSSRVLHHLSSPSMKQHKFFLAHSFGQGNGIGVLANQGNGIGVLANHHHCNWKTATCIPLRKASRSIPCQVKSEDSEGTLSSESIMLDEQALERELQIAIEEENYVRAAKIRDSLRFLHEDGKASVLAANARFYNYFKNGDLASMQALWAKGDNVCVVHPGVSGISGYDLVMGSWEFVWADYEFPLEIEIKDVQVHVRGDLGYVTCTELVKTKGSSWGRQFATNVFERIDGQWFICIHHASHVDL